MTTRAESIVDTMLGIDPMADLPRTGWLLRGVRPCESIADHSYGVAFVTMLLVDALRAEDIGVDGELALRMALVHDTPEARTGDVPMPNKTAEMSAALHTLERALSETLLPTRQREDWQELETGDSIESRIVKAADKIQMMVKALVYERQQRGALGEFWENPKNFDARGLEIAREVFDAICARASRQLPR
jgi:putative hydrolase of HD superfamily